MQLYLLLLNEDMYHTKTKNKNNLKKPQKTFCGRKGRDFTDKPLTSAFCDFTGGFPLA